MAKTSDVVLTVPLSDWDEFKKDHRYNPYVQCATIKVYVGTDIVNVKWDFVKWFTKDKYIDEILDFFTKRSYLITALNEDNSVYQEDHVQDDEDLSDFWDYAPQVKLITDF